MSEPTESLLKTIDLSKSQVRHYEGFIFLCGGKPIADSGEDALPVSVRHGLLNELAGRPKVANRLKIAESFEDWFRDSVYTDLVLFETHLAQLSSLIVVALESPGSLTELGLFVAIEEFRKKLLVVINESHYDQTSFIRFGPIDYLEKSHQNLAACYQWIQIVDGKEVINKRAIYDFQKDLADLIVERSTENHNEVRFNTNNWLHISLLICDLINICSALSLEEILRNLQCLGVILGSHELKQFLFMLQKTELIGYKTSGRRRFYLSKKSDAHLILKTGEKSLDFGREKLIILDWYRINDRKRHFTINKFLRGD